MTPTQALVVTSAAALLLVASRRSGGRVEAGEGDYISGISLSALADSGEAIINRITEESANVEQSTADRNVSAFLSMLRRAEGTDSRDGYRACYGYAHTIADLSEHPAVSGEWRGEVLPDAMCANAGFGPGCVSTAAGAYQLIKPTWISLRNALGLPDFSEASQDAAAVEAIRRRGALQDVMAGRFAQAISKCRNEWASLPGNYAGQGQRSMGQLLAWIDTEGGTAA